MRKICLIVLLFSASFSNAQTWDWKIKAGGSHADISFGLTTDKSGCFYITGVHSDSAYFGGSMQFGYRGYLAKYSCDSSLIWIRNFENATCYGIAIDNNDNVFITGLMQNASSFDTINVQVDSNFTGIFVAKFDSAGSALWVCNPIKTMGTISVNDIVVDANSNVYFIGHSDYITVIGNDTTMANGKSILVSKIDSVGHMSWGKQYQQFNGKDNGNGIDIDLNGDIYITGRLSADSTLFDSFNLGQPYTYFFVKIDNKGSVLWAQGATNALGYDIISDDANNVYVIGYFMGSAIFGTDTLHSISQDYFVIKYDTSGSIVWYSQSVSMSNGTSVTPHKIRRDNLNNLYVISDLIGISSINGVVYNSNINGNLFVVKYDTSGTIPFIKFANTVYGSYSDMSVDTIGDIYLTGSFGVPCCGGSIFFDNDSLTSNGSWDIFVAKLSQSSVGISETSNEENGAIVYPNPFSNETTIRFDKTLINAELQLFDVMGKQVSSIKNISSQVITLERNNLSDGIYLYQITESKTMTARGKLIVY